MNHTAASLAQRQKNIQTSNRRRASAMTCARGHSNWVRLKDGRRQCRTCKTDREWYRRCGFRMIA